MADHVHLAERAEADPLHPAQHLLRLDEPRPPPAGQVHPVPTIDISVIPDGTVSVTVTVPLVGPAPAAFDTVTLYVTPVCPCMKFPVWLFRTLKTGGFALMIVLSLVLLLADAPPDTDTEFNSGVPAFAATFTVTVIG